MKTANVNNKIQNTLLGLLAAITIFSFSSCAKQITFLVSPVVPAARGVIKVTQDKNKNYVIDVKISSLSEVERLEPSKKVYVIWMVTDKDVTVNLGQVTSSMDNLSKKLKASFKTVSSFKPSKIFITAEDDAGIQAPEAQTILTTNRF